MFVRRWSCPTMFISSSSLINEKAREVYSLAEIMDTIKGASAHLINRLLARNGRVWQEESFDRVLRCSEKLDEKVRTSDNPCSRGLVGNHEDYPWTWVAPVMTASVG